MQVFKFGGASVSTIERIKNVAHILRAFSGERLLVVISAMGKTTNALEEVVKAFYGGDSAEALRLFGQIKTTHLEVAAGLSDQPMDQLNDLFTEVEWLLHDQPQRDFDYYYDQVVCIGELLSTCIISNYLNAAGVPNKWVDVRDVLRTDNNFRDARIDWNITNTRVQNAIVPLYEDYPIVITQGFIGATDENESTTLGREGSDYTAAIFANLLDAKAQTIWKDVPGVMNADPKLYTKAELIRELSYREVIEMAYYGAQVIHPKTIKPLQNKSIPLYVRSFLNPDAPGTLIHNGTVQHLPPIIVYKQQQALVQLSTRDFSFVGEGLSGQVEQVFQELKTRPNLTQNGAISLLYVMDDTEKAEHFAATAAGLADVQLQRGLTLLTIRHYTDELVGELCNADKVILQQKTPETLQVLLTQ
jgi:aspartate kinase